MPFDIDENIRYDINQIVQDLSQRPEAILNLLDNISAWQKGEMPSLKTFWQLGLKGSSTLLYRGSRLWLNGASDPLKMLLENGLIEELAKINPEQLQKILAIAVDHPAVIDQESPYINIIKDLNDPDFLQACLSKTERIKHIYQRVKFYREAVNVESPSISGINYHIRELTHAMLDLASEPEVRESLKPLASSKLMNHIHDIPILAQYSNSKKLFAHLARKQPEEFQKTLGTILSQDKSSRDKVTNAVLGYANLPINESGDEKLEQLIQKNWEEMIHSLVELASKEDVREDLKKLATKELIKDIYDLDALANQQGSRKLVVDLAKDNPIGFQNLVEEILASPYKETIIPATTKLLSYLSSTDEKTPENKAIRDEMLLEFSKISAEPRVAKKIAPLLSGSFVSNLLEMEGLESYKEYKDLFEKVSDTLSKNPQMFNLLLKTYNETKIEDVSDKTLVDVPEVVEDNKQEIIEDKGKSYFDSLKRIAESISQRIRGKKSSKIVEEIELELSKPNDVRTVKIVNIIREASKAMDNESIQNILAEPQLKTLIAGFIRDNPNVMELHRLGIKEDELVSFAKSFGTKDGLNAVADYMENKTTLPELVAKTNNRTFVIKNLHKILPIYYKHINSKAKSQAKEEANKLHSFFSKIKNVKSWVQRTMESKNTSQRQQ